MILNNFNKVVTRIASHIMYYNLVYVHNTHIRK